MPISNSYVRARIDAKTKKKAIVALESMGLSVSDAIRLLLVRIAHDRRLPFEVRGAKTREAIAELESGKGKKARTISALMDDLHEDD
ncbi:MAG TPA: type II toxin-antitoxin system RelB/DinJ family antitoxin [Coxiellaceae bacterium]|nr:MAG: translation repressor RelB [Gammaproteobacteria bacterium RIFCSPHIGHO2_12_FULL_36_30]HLB56221.1 type II toxin-antitoxin system RelB/DinJ family antitoxin [Coxiellaceae bacterium]